MLDTIENGTDPITGVETMAYAGTAPWGDLGVKVHNDLTPEQMLEKAGLNWEVKALSLRAQLRGKNITVPNKKVLVRESDGKVFDTIGSGWKPVQNAEAFGFFHEFVMNGEMEMHTAGALEGGRKVWALARIKDGSFELPGNDIVESYLLFYNPHQYGKKLGVMFTNIRVWCDNTLNLALSTASNSAFFNHRRAFDPEYAKEILGLAARRKEEVREKAEYLASRRTTEETLEQYFGKLFGKKKNGEPKKIEEIVRENYESQPGAHAGEGTWWQAVNSVTYAVDHKIGRSVDSRMDSAWFGRNAQLKRNAIELALDMA